MELDDQQILRQLQAGNRQCFEALFRNWYSPLCNYALGILHSRDEAEEVVQSIFINFWEKRDQLMITSSIKSYLYQAVRNRCFNVMKHQKVKQQHASFAMANGSMDAEPANTHLLTSELATRIEHAMAQLPEQCRIVFKMSRFEELKYAEIASRLGISIKTVENQMGKALKIMREHLKDYLVITLLIAGAKYYALVDNYWLNLGTFCMSLLNLN